MRSRITGGFWEGRQLNVLDDVIPYQWAVLNDEIEGREPLRGDVAKFLEAAAYSLSIRPDEKLEADIDGLIHTIELAQDEDGYLNTSSRLRNREKRYTNLRDWHEMYHTGHFLEAAVAYKRATGKGRLLEIMERNVDHTMTVVGREDGKLHGYPGHEELELALCKAYELTGKRKYLEFAKYLIDERGREPLFFIEEEEKRDFAVQSDYFADQQIAYFQAHMPVRDQEKAIGHSVRAGYLYSGMADIARLTHDDDLKVACSKLFANIANSQIYITGSVGQTHIGEAFSVDYDLPNDTVYAETCAAISMIFFAKRMLRLEQHSKYADVMETALYNGALSGISLDGTKYFYVNPLEVHPGTVAGNPEYQHVKLERQAWFGCACCPPNIARLLASLQDYIYTLADGTLFTDLYISGETTLNGTTITQTTDYPNNGDIAINISGGELPVALRIPGWCDEWSVAINGEIVDDKPVRDGYLMLGTLKDGDEVRLSLNIEPRLITCHEKVRANAGMVALQYGPLVYCVEQIDNGENLHQLLIDPAKPVTATYENELLNGVTKLVAEGYRQSLAQESLYATWRNNARQPVHITFVPYFAWANRGVGEMRVWVRRT